MAKTALITGASSGIGKEMAIELSKRGFKCILAARRVDRLVELADTLEGETMIFPCDLSDKNNCFDLHEKLKDEKISVLINAAGFGLFGEFKDADLEREIQMIDTNITAVHILTKLFLKDFIRSDRGYILNVASSAGLMSGGPFMSAYYASKAYVTDLSLAIYQELKQSKSNVHISVLCPGPVDTEFNDVAGCKFGVKSISAERCAKEGLKGLFRQDPLIVPEKSLKAMIGASKFVPRELLVKITGDVQKRKQN